MTWRGKDPASIVTGSVGCETMISTWVFLYAETPPRKRRSPTSRSPKIDVSYNVRNAEVRHSGSYNAAVWRQVCAKVKIWTEATAQILKTFLIRNVVDFELDLMLSYKMVCMLLLVR